MRVFFILSAIFLSISTYAEIISFKDDYQKSFESGCVVNVEKRKIGQIFNVESDYGLVEIGVTYNLSGGSFSYCKDSALQISKKDNKIIMTCDEHLNENATTKGFVEIEMQNDKLTKIQVKGSVKGFLGWEDEVDLLCE